MSALVRPHQDPYSPYKVVHHQDRLCELREGRQPVPLHVHLVISDRCNQRCAFCAYRLRGSTSSELFLTADADGGASQPSRQIQFSKCDEILRDCAGMGVKAIQFTGGGEPLMHPDHARILTLARELGLDVALVTNGTLMNQEALDALCGAAWVRVSLDAATEETYSDLRRVRPEHFRRALGAIEDLVAMRDRESNGTLIGVGFVVTNSNHAEIRQAVRLCSDLGVDNVRISGAFTPEGFAYHAAFFERAKEMATGAKMDYERDGFRVFDLYDDRIRDLKETGPDDPFCGYMHLATYIGADLNVYRCCVLAYNRQGLIGSVAHQGFRSLWRSEEKQKAFAGFDARKCPRCMFYSKNRFIKYCMSKDPIHVNFV